MASRITRTTPTTMIAATKSESSGIDPGEMRQADGDAAEDHRESAERVARHVEEGGAHVEVALAVFRSSKPTAPLIASPCRDQRS